MQPMPRTLFSVLGSILCDEGHIVALQRTLFTSKIEKKTVNASLMPNDILLKRFDSVRRKDFNHHFSTRNRIIFHLMSLTADTGVASSMLA